MSAAFMDLVFPLIGLASERQRLLDAIRKQQSLRLLGPAGSGKSTLIRAAVGDFPNSHGIIHLRYAANLHHLLVDLARALLQTRHRTLRKLARAGNDEERWLAEQTSIHLRGILWTSLEAEPRTIILDGVDRGSFPTYRFLQRLYFAKGMALHAAARTPVALGALARLFWDPRTTVHLRPLNEFEAGRLFDLAVDRFRLGDLNLEDFREKVLDAGKGNPGQIIEMCRMASNPMYLSGRHIKFAPLRIDTLMKFL
jgi:energy-coupling factor transporter ATP-binding protein EcfA2